MSQRLTITELQEKILQRALRECDPTMSDLYTLQAKVDAVDAAYVVSKSRSQMADNIHRWVQMHVAEKL